MPGSHLSVLHEIAHLTLTTTSLEGNLLHHLKDRKKEGQEEKYFYRGPQLLSSRPWVWTQSDSGAKAFYTPWKDIIGEPPRFFMAVWLAVSFWSQNEDAFEIGPSSRYQPFKSLAISSWVEIDTERSILYDPSA